MSLWDIRLHLAQGRFTLDLDRQSEARVLGLFGPSGSGKTTCLESIAGLRRQAAGFLRCGEHVWMDSAHGIRLKAEQRHIGYVPQEHLLFPHLNARQNLAFGMARGMARGKGQRPVFDEVVEVLELGKLLEHRIDQLSGGQRQRIALGRALCSAPRMLMLDEPLAALDTALRQRILPFLIRVREHFNIPMLVVSHNPLELQTLCDEVIALDQGKAIAQGRPVDVFTETAIDPNIAAEGFINVLPASVIEQRTHSTRIQLGNTGPELSILQQERQVGETLSVGLPACDILVATQPIEGLSARNSLPAIARQLRRTKGKVILTADLLTGLPPIVVELTPDSVEDLHIEPGKTVQLIIKSSSISVYGE